MSRKSQINDNRLGPRVYAAAGALFCSREAKFPYKLLLACAASPERKRKSIVSRLIKFCAGSFPEIRWQRRRRRQLHSSVKLHLNKKDERHKVGSGGGGVLRRPDSHCL